MKLKNAVAKGLIAVMMCGMLTACQKDDVSISADTQTESEVDQEVEDTGKEEASTEESEAEESETEESSDETVISDEANAEWSEHYKGFFENYDTNHMMINAKAEYEDANVNMSMIIGLGIVDDNMFFQFGMDMGKGENSVTMYVSDEGYAYLEESIFGEKVCVKAKTEGNEGDIFSSISSEETFGLDQETASKIVYDHEEVIDGVTYDVLVAEVDDNKAFYYVNRDTQELEKISVPYEGGQMLDCLVSRIDKIDMPVATEEISSDELGEKLEMDLMAILFSALGNE